MSEIRFGSDQGRRIVFLAGDDESAGEMQRQVFARFPRRVVGTVLSSCRIYKKRDTEAALFLLSHSGMFYTASMIWIKILKKMLPRTGTTTPLRLSRQYGTPVIWSRNINDEMSRQLLASWAPDIVISTNFNHFIGGRARKIARFGTWNLHKSFLPSYRGMAPSFYALLNGEEYSGATLHVVDEGFDTGDIIDQVKVPILNNDTVSSLNLRIAGAGGDMLADVIGRFHPGDVVTRPQPSGNWRQYSYPGRVDIAAFKRKKLKFDRVLSKG